MKNNPKTKAELLRNLLVQACSEPKSPDELLKIVAKRGVRVGPDDISGALDALTESGAVMRARGNLYAVPSVFGCRIGTFCATGHPYNFVTPDGGDADIFIPPHRSKDAWQGDRVLIHVLSESGGRDRTRKEAEVYRVLSPATRELTGRLLLRGKMMIFQAENGKYPDIIISKKNINDAHPGDRVAIQVLFRGGGKYMPQGRVTQVFGSGLSLEAATNAILFDNNISFKFPQEVLQEADALAPMVSPSDCAGRLDLRRLTLFTIDGDTAKDFDDAVSLEILPNGHLRLGVHIADVSYYVKPGSPLDQEAFQRGTSVYYADCVIPMLPFPLSNGICSLNPGVNRLAFTAFIELGKDGTRYSAEFHHSVICSFARLTYNQVNRMLSGDEKERALRPDIAPILDDMNVLAKCLHTARMLRGALELDIPEAVIECDSKGKAIGVSARQRGDSERMIEEFMLVANEAVAEVLCRKQHPAVYRVHEDPDPEKLRLFAQQARMYGYRIKDSELSDTSALQAILDKAATNPEHRALPTLLLRSLARARYAPECLGHYGLAAKYYLHFTSPIRRYPDLMVHRMLSDLLEGGKGTKEQTELCSDASIQSSDREFAADTAERDIEKLYMADYMSQFIGHNFTGYISGVTNFGVFVCLDNLVEGMVRLDSIQNDWFEYDPQRMTLFGKHTGKNYHLGMPVEVTLTSASPITGQIDFVFPPDEGTQG